MLYTQFNMEDALEVRYEEGMEQGRLQMLTEKVCRKLQKGKTPAVIAEELEEELSLIETICAASKECGPEAAVEEICRVLEKEA